MVADLERGYGVKHIPNKRLYYFPNKASEEDEILAKLYLAFKHKLVKLSTQFFC